MYSTPAMSLFETDKIPLQEENYGDNNNLMDNLLYTWSTGAYIPSREPLLPPLQPRTVMMVDQGSQYVNPFLQPYVRPTTSSGHNTPPTYSAHTQTDLPFERLVINTDQNIGQASLNQPSTSSQHIGHGQNWTDGQPQWWGQNPWEQHPGQINWANNQNYQPNNLGQVIL